MTELPFSQPPLELLPFTDWFLSQANGFLVPFWSPKTAQEISSKKQFSGPASPGGRQDIMRSKMDDLLQLLLAHDQEVGEDGGQHVKTFIIYL